MHHAAKRPNPADPAQNRPSSTQQTRGASSSSVTGTPCTPLNLMKAELRRVAKKDAEDQPQTRHPTVEDEDDRRLIQADDFLERVKQYIECGVKRKWMQSTKSQQLKVTGWQLHQGRRPLFSSLTWSRSSVSRINQVISGHLPTREYLHSHGYELKTQNVGVAADIQKRGTT